MYRLFYVSTVTPAFVRDDLPELVKALAKKNAELGITGALKFNGVNFAEVLEGPKKIVLSQMDEIKADRRHSGLIVIGAMDVQERLFDDWTMSVVGGLDFQDFVNAMVPKTALPELS